MAKPDDHDDKRREWGAEDIGPLLDRWTYRPGEVQARAILDSKGREKLQMRVALGILQMEIDGRPDGERPHGSRSLFDFLKRKLKEHVEATGEEAGFILSEEECEELRLEAYAYYLRYICFFRLKRFAGAARDTARNLRVVEFVKKFAESPDDQLSLEQYRPYIRMMNARANAYIQVQRGRRKAAAGAVRRAIRDIKGYYRTMERDFEGLDSESMIEASEELWLLRDLLSNLESESIPDARLSGESDEEEEFVEPWQISEEEAAPIDEEEKPEVDFGPPTIEQPRTKLDFLRIAMKRAVDDEDYARAANLRDQIKALQRQKR